MDEYQNSPLGAQDYQNIAGSDQPPRNPLMEDSNNNNYNVRSSTADFNNNNFGDQPSVGNFNGNNFDNQPFRDNIMTSKDHPAPKRKTFALRYILMWVSGTIFIPCLISSINTIIQSFIDPTFSVSIFSSQLYVPMMTALLVFGATHIGLSFSCLKDFSDGPTPKWVNVMSYIYAAGFGITALVFVWIVVSMLFNMIMGTDTYKGYEIATQMLGSIISIVILLLTILEQTRMVRHIPPKIFPLVMAAISLLTIVLFIVGPVSHSRDVAYDDRLENDLIIIQNAVEDYIDTNNSVPNDLNFINANRLDNPINLYSIKQKNTKGSSRSSLYPGYYSQDFSYQLCATFKTNTLEDGATSDYGYYYHSAGNYCFDREYYSSYSGGYHPPIIYD